MSAKPVGTKRKERAYSYEVRREVLRLRSDGFSVSAVTSKLGIPPATISQWATLCAVAEGSYLSEEELDAKMRDWKTRYGAPPGAQMALTAPRPERGLRLDRGKLGEVVAAARARVEELYQGENSISGVLKAATGMALLAAWEEALLDLPRVEKWTDMDKMLNILFEKLDIQENHKESRRQGIDIRILNTPRNRQNPVDVEASVVEG